MHQLKTIWAGLDTRRRLIAVLSAVAVLVAILGLARAATEPSMALLYSGLDATAAGEVVAALEAEGVPSRSTRARSSSTPAPATASAWSSPPGACRPAARPATRSSTA